MKWIFTPVLMCLVALASFSQVAPLNPGSPIPKANLKMKDVSGKLIALSDVRTQQGLLVMFSCNTCPYVVKNQARTRALGAFAKEKGVGFIILNANERSRDSDDSFKSMQQYAKTQGYDWPYVVDSNNEMADAFGANRTPECFLFDSNGKLVYRGAIDDSPADESKIQRKHLEVAISDLVEGRAVTVKESRSVGCSIRRKGR